MYTPNTRGVARAVWLAAALALVMLIVVLTPWAMQYYDRLQAVNCMQSLDSAARELAVDFLAVNDRPTAKEAKELAAAAMDGWDDICPAGGSVYVVPGDEGLPWVLVCGIHGADRRQVVRLNASNVREMVEDALFEGRRRGRTPTDLTVELNGKDLTVTLLQEPNRLRTGTDSNIDYKGTVAFYTADPSSHVSWLVYAEPDYAAVWRADDGWTGDSYTAEVNP